MTSRIRKVFASQEGLTGIVKQLPLDVRFQLDNVKTVMFRRRRARRCVSAVVSRQLLLAVHVVLLHVMLGLQLLVHEPAW